MGHSVATAVSIVRSAMGDTTGGGGEGGGLVVPGQSSNYFDIHVHCSCYSGKSIGQIAT